MLKILFVTTASSTAYVFLLNFAHYLTSKGFIVEFACSAYSFHDAKSRFRELEEEGFVVHNVPFSRKISPINDCISFITLQKVINDNHYDIIHVHTAKAGWLGRIAGRLSKVPLIIYTAHDFYFRAFQSGFNRRFYVFLEKIASPFCDIILFVSDAVKSDAIKENIKKSDNLFMVGNGIQCDTFIINPAFQKIIKTTLGIQAGTKIIGIVARLVDNKGIDLFIHAASIISIQYPDVKFIICGSGPDESKLKSLVAKLMISDKVIFTGRIESKEELNHLISCFDIFLFPTRREGLGIVYIEAMALGVPVIGTRIPPVTEIIIEGKTGLLAAVEDYNDFAAAAISLLSDPELSLRLADAARKRAWEFFNLPVINLRTINAYYSAIKSKKSANKLLAKWPNNPSI